MDINVYFISGFCANCKVFNNIILPKGYKKIYLEWHVPFPGETIEDYAETMAHHIDRNLPFILVGYSLGGILIQEMNKFLDPLKNIIIASIKNDNEIPSLFRLGRKIRFAEYFPFWHLADNRSVKKLFSRFIYNMRNVDIFEYVSYTNPIYMKWGVAQILNWRPSSKCKNLFHIHGTLDKTFPARLIKDAYFIDNGDHFMVLKKSQKVNKALNKILLEK